MRHLLFPVDFSPQCDAVTPAVAAMARRFGARVTKIYAAKPPEGPGDFGALQGHFTTAAEEMRGGLDSYQSAAFDGIETDSVFRLGRPVQEIVDFAQSNGVDLIMMPTHGYSPFRQLLLGSVTSGVLHDAGCAVWTCAHTGEAGAALSADYKSIVCALDLGPSSVDLHAAATEFAAAFGASVHPVHVGDGQAETTLAEPVEIVDAANVAAGVATSVERYRADLLVIGRGKAQGILGRLRSNAHDLIRHSRCPVLSI